MLNNFEKVQIFEKSKLTLLFWNMEKSQIFQVIHVLF